MMTSKLRGTRKNNKQSADDEIKQAMSDEIQYRIMRNPFVVIIGISEYDEPNETLNGVSNDIDKMKELWQNRFKYQNVQCITDKIGSNYVCAKTLNSFLNDVSCLIQLNKTVDGLIIIYSGHGSHHGSDHYIVCSDNNALSFTSIQEKFGAEKLDFLGGKPKIIYFDCCRGNQQLNNDHIKIQSKGDKYIAYINKLSDFMIHFATCQNYEAVTFKLDGGLLTNAIYKCYINNYEYHKRNAINLHETSIKVNEMINVDFKGQQTSEIIDRLTYDVYIMPYSQKKINIQIASPPKLRIHSEKIKKQNEEKQATIDKLRSENSQLLKQLNDLKAVMNKNDNNDQTKEHLRSKCQSRRNSQINAGNHKNDENDGNNEIESKNESSWTKSLSSMVTHAKHRMYTMGASPSFKWDSHNNKHSFSLSHDVWIMGNHYTFNKEDESNNRNIIQSVVSDIYSKIWITYRSNFPNILSSQYTSDAGWGCMLRTTQMMVAQALIIYYFDYSWNLTKLNEDSNKINIYYNSILALFNDNIKSPLSIHNMISYGSTLYDKPVGHWYGPNQTCNMITKCIEKSKELSAKIECIVCESGIIYKSNISLRKYSLIFVPLRLGLDSLNINYIESIKQCFHFPECIGIIGGKPRKSLYFIGYQDSNLFYLDPHTVFQSPNINKSLSKQKCIFHCQEINSLPTKHLDPSMTVAFFIKPSQIHLNKFWQNIKKIMNKQYCIFSVADQPANHQKGFDNDSNDNDIYIDINGDEWVIL